MATRLCIGLVGCGCMELLDDYVMQLVIGDDKFGGIYTNTIECGSGEMRDF